MKEESQFWKTVEATTATRNSNIMQHHFEIEGVKNSLSLFVLLVGCCLLMPRISLVGGSTGRKEHESDEMLLAPSVSVSQE